MRKMLFFLAFLLFFLGGSNAHALYWNIHCVNNSCEATSGGMAVYWSGDIGGGELTGVKLPISLELVAEMAQAAEQTWEKAISRSRSKGAKAGVEQSGTGASKENTESYSITKKRSMTSTERQSLANREDLTLRFFEHFSKYCRECILYRGTQAQKWFVGAEMILKKYKEGTINDDMYMYFLHEKLKNIELPQIEKMAIQSDPEDGIPMLRYVLNMRNPYNNFPAFRDEYYNVVKAFYAKDLWEAAQTHEGGAFTRYLLDQNRIPPIDYSNGESVITKYFQTGEYKDDIPKFKEKIASMKRKKIISQTLIFTIPAVVIITGVFFVIKKRKKKSA